MEKRVSSRAIIIEDGKLLAMFRRKIKKDGSIKEYYVIPGGGLEEGETLEENVKFLGTEEYDDTIANYFLCKIVNGEPRLGGEELERMTQENYYEIRYIDLKNIDNYDINAKDLIKSIL